jgi:hypothetical protein
MYTVTGIGKSQIFSRNFHHLPLLSRRKRLEPHIKSGEIRPKYGLWVPLVSHRFRLNTLERVVFPTYPGKSDIIQPFQAKSIAFFQHFQQNPAVAMKVT